MSIESEIEFCFKLLRTIHLSNDNAVEKPTIFAPSLILSALAMTYAASDGITADEIAKVIGEGKNRDEIIEYYSNFIQFCKSLKNTTDEPFNNPHQICYELLLANRLFISEEPLSEEWKKIMNEKFDGDFEAVDFGKKVGAAEKMNKFVEEKTDGNIKKIVNGSDIDNKALLFIVNALCFKGLWKKPFDNPKLQNFYSNGKIREIEMITHKASSENWNLTKGEDWECLGIPFKTNQSWLHILLPKEKEGLPELLEKIDYSLIEKCVKTHPVGSVIATIPTFQIESNMKLEDALKSMGIKEAFREDGQKIRNLFENKHVNIGNAIHKAGIKVDQYGTFGYAAGAFGFKMQRFHEPEIFVADHPFIFFVTLITDKEPQNLKSILLMGIFC